MIPPVRFKPEEVILSFGDLTFEPIPYVDEFIKIDPEYEGVFTYSCPIWAICGVCTERIGDCTCHERGAE